MRLDELHPTISVRHAVDGRRDVEVVYDARLRGNVRISQIPATYVWTPPRAAVELLSPDTGLRNKL
jgi:hypothetical protein